MADVVFKEAREQARLIRDGALSAEALMAATYDQIERVNPTVNALVDLLPREEALARARLSDAQGEGLLKGLPVAVKDLANAQAFRTTMGSPRLAGAGPVSSDDVFVARMRAAGAIVIGKTNTPEFGLGSHTFNPVHSATRNPWDVTRSAGGSSGGATVALACGMVSLADGSDMMGSLRNPAGWSNTYGLRPSWGLVPSEPKRDMFLHQLSTAGPMARTPGDLELLLRVMAGRDPRQPHGRALEPAEMPTRIAWLSDWGGAYACEDGVLALCEAALPHLSACGASYDTPSVPFPADQIWQAWTTLRSWQVAASLSSLFAQPAGRTGLKEEALWELNRGLSFSAMEVHRASVTRSAWFSAAMAFFASYDVIALPTAQVFPFPVDDRWPTQIGSTAMDTYHRWMEVTVPASLIGLPAIAVPAGFSAEGLPMGLQFIGRPGTDLGLIELARRWHAATPWCDARPPCAMPPA